MCSLLHKREHYWTLHPFLKKGNIHRSCLKLQTGLTNVWSFTLIVFNLGSFQGIMWHHWMMNFFLNSSRKCSHGTKIGKLKQTIVRVLKHQGNCSLMTKGNCQSYAKYIIFENKIRSSKPCVNIVFLLTCCMSVWEEWSQPFPLTLTLPCRGLMGCLGTHREMLPRESKVGTRLSTATWEMALFPRRLRLRQPSMVSFPHNSLLQSSLQMH